MKDLNSRLILQLPKKVSRLGRKNLKRNIERKLNKRRRINRRSLLVNSGSLGRIRSKRILRKMRILIMKKKLLF